MTASGAGPVVDHVFVLMLENRSFDHMLGLSRITGRDSLTNQVTEIDGLTGTESNSLLDGKIIPVTAGADYALSLDPKHNFGAVVEQLCGPLTTYPPGGPYPSITNSGFASSCVTAFKLGADADVPTMRAFRPEQLPVLNALAREYAVCDHWFSSMPGPTWPNRFFAHAASSADLDDSPSPLRSTGAVFDGYRFSNGTVFDHLDGKWCVVEGGALPVTLAMHGMVGHVIDGRFITMDEFKERLGRDGFDLKYTFIEPDYGHILLDGKNFKCGNSQHPLDDVTRGERLIKDVYEAIRNSKYWERSLLIVVYDEHGGFYDHVPPPAAVAPGDSEAPGNNVNGFRFTQLGVRVPALVISPYIPAGVVDHTPYDHTSIISSLGGFFGFGHLTERDKAASTVEHLLSLTEPRLGPDDARVGLPDPIDSGIPDCEGSFLHKVAGEVENIPGELAERPLDEALVGFLHIAWLRDAHMAAVEGTTMLTAIKNKISELRTAADHNIGSAAGYIRQVEKRYESWRGEVQHLLP
jgi:phospholipase C